MLIFKIIFKISKHHVEEKLLHKISRRYTKSSREFAREEFPKYLTSALEKLLNPTDRAMVTEGLLDKKTKDLFGAYKDIVKPIHAANLKA